MRDFSETSTMSRLLYEFRGAPDENPTTSSQPRLVPRDEPSAARSYPYFPTRIATS